MPKITNRSRKIPKFIKKLIQILDDPKYPQLVAWLPEMNGFQIFNTSRFIDEVLPNFFRHKNMASFVRQLNMYGFNRPKDSDQHVYFHPRFIKGNMNSMRQIQRKAPEGHVMTEEDESEDIHQNIQQDCLNLSMVEACEKLLIQNKKLRKQNEQLCRKLSILARTKQILSNISQCDQLFKSEQFEKKNQENSLAFNSQETMVEKTEQIPQIHSFSFGSAHDGLKSRLSYLSLINGAKENSDNSRNSPKKN